MHKIFTILVFLVISKIGFAQNNTYWKISSENNYTENELVYRSNSPKKFFVYELNTNQFLKQLSKVTVGEKDILQSDVILSMPISDGSFEDFQFSKYEVMHPDLQKKFPEIQNYKAISLQNKGRVAYLSVNSFGIHSIIHTAGSPISYMDTFTKDHNAYIVYSRNDIDNVFAFQCSFDNEEDHIHEELTPTKSSSGVFKTYRIAISTTIEYSNYHRIAAGISNSASVAVKKAAVLSAIVTAVTRLNSVYNRDLGVHLQLIANNDLLININSDNFSNNNASAMLSENQNFIDSLIPWDDYDIGHIFSTGGGGVAILQSVCSLNKAKGVTGSPQPVNDPFVIDYVAHEVGHQFGATHTFNGLGTNCTQSTRTNSTAVEPGSGSTVMGYAGICSPVNVQNNSDAYFHTSSMLQIASFVSGSGNCSENETVINTPPTIKSLKNYSLPKSTPFVLDAIAFDAEDDALTYCWEQTNNNISTQPPVSTNTIGPTFRSRMPSANSFRYFPLLSSVVNNNLSPAYEVVPSVARTMNFALTVRDNNTTNRAQSRRASSSLTVVNVGPFLVQTPNTNVSWAVGTNQTVTWDVAGTTANNINCKNVDILLSTNGGVSFDHLLASKVPNDGSEVVTIPNIVGNSNRIMVKGNNHIFYDLSNTNFSIVNNSSPTFSVRFSGVSDQQNINNCKGTSVVYPILFEKIGNFTASTNFSVTGNPSGTTVALSQSSATENATINVTLSNLGSLASGVYPMQFKAVSGLETKIVNLYLEISTATFASIANLQPANNSTIVDSNPVLSWQADNTASGYSYVIQIATDASFNNIIEEGLSYTNNYTPTSVLQSQAYYWRVAAKNESGCRNNFNNSFKFTFQNLSTEIFENKNFDFVVYPNPNQGVFNLKMSQPIDGIYHINIFDLQGRNIFNSSKTFSDGATLEVSIPQASPGIYLVKVDDGSRQFVKKIILK